MAVPSPSTSVAPRRDHLRVVDEHAAVPVVVACASADVGDVETAALSLGGDVVVDGGLEHDPFALRHAAQRAERPTLFVVCKTAELDAATVRRVVESFGGRTAAGHRLLVLELVSNRVAGFTGTLRRAREQLGRACERNGMILRAGSRDASIVESVGGETHYDHALARLEPNGAVRRVEAIGDRTGPIPPHVRARGEKPHLAIVDDKETAEDLDAESFADLRPPEQRIAAAETRVERVPISRGTFRVIALVVAAVVTAAAGLVLG
jgi:hypothetical protein